MLGVPLRGDILDCPPDSRLGVVVWKPSWKFWQGCLWE